MGSITLTEATHVMGPLGEIIVTLCPHNYGKGVYMHFDWEKVNILVNGKNVENVENITINLEKKSESHQSPVLWSQQELLNWQESTLDFPINPKPVQYPCIIVAMDGKSEIIYYSKFQEARYTDV